MSITIDQIIVDSKKMGTRLKSRVALADSLIAETEAVNEQLETMRQFQDDFNALNLLARGRSNAQMINMINQESPHVREVELKNRELRAALEDHQRALEVIMSKYREQTQNQILNTKINFHDYHNDEKNEIIKRQSNQINEMTAIMQKALSFDESDLNKDREHFNRLMTENKGLREMLQISKQYGSCGYRPGAEDKSVQTEPKVSLTVNNEDNKSEMKDDS